MEPTSMFFKNVNSTLLIALTHVIFSLSTLSFFSLKMSSKQYSGIEKKQEKQKEGKWIKHKQIIPCSTIQLVHMYTHITRLHFKLIHTDTHFETNPKTRNKFFFFWNPKSKSKFHISKPYNLNQPIPQTHEQLQRKKLSTQRKKGKLNK